MAEDFCVEEMMKNDNFGKPVIISWSYAPRKLLVEWEDNGGHHIIVFKEDSWFELPPEKSLRASAKSGDKQ